MVGNFIDSTREAVRTGLCNYLTFAGKGRSWLNELSPADLPDFGEFWNRVLCDRNAPLPEGPPQFTGGQCPTQYSFQCERRIRDSQCDGYGAWNPIGPFGSYTGPIGGVSVVTRTAQNGGFIDEISISTATGVVDTAAVARPEDCGLVAEIRNIQFNRLDGQPDNCGDPAPVVPPFPPQGDTVNIDITYVNNDGDNVTELGDLNIFAPVVIAPVTIVAPIRVDLPDVSFNGNIVLSPDFNIELQPPSFRRGPGNTDGPPPDEDPTTSPDTPEDDSDRGLIGAITTVTGGITDGKATQLDGDSGPDLFVPRMGTLSFRVRTATSLAWSQPLDIKTTTQFHPAPNNVQLLDAVATPNPGYTIAVTLVYADSRP